MNDEDKFNSRKMFILAYGSPELIDEHIDKWHPDTKRERESYHSSQVARRVISNQFALPRHIEKVVSSIPYQEIDSALGLRALREISNRKDLTNNTRAKLFTSDQGHVLKNLVSSKQTTPDELMNIIKNPVMSRVYAVTHQEITSHPNFSKEHHAEMLKRELHSLDKDEFPNMYGKSVGSIINNSPHLTKNEFDSLTDSVIKNPSAMSGYSTHTHAIRSLSRHPFSSDEQRKKMFYHAKDPDLTYDIIHFHGNIIPKEALMHHAMHNLSKTVRIAAVEKLYERGIHFPILDNEEVIHKDISIPKEYQ